MRRLIFSIALTMPSVAYANAQCDYIIQHAAEQSSILRAPSVIVGAGDASVTDQNIIEGVQIDLAARKQAALIDDAAQVQCFLAVTLDRLNRYIKYSPVTLDQVQATAENNILGQNWETVEKQETLLHQLVDTHFATLNDLNTYTSEKQSLLERRFNNDQILAISNRLDPDINISDEVSLYREYTRKLETLQGAQFRASGWSLAFQAGSRQPVYGSPPGVKAFASVSFRYSFGMGASARAAAKAEEAAVNMQGDVSTDPVYTLNDLRVTYMHQITAMRMQLELINNQVSTYENMLAKFDGVDIPQARVTKASTQILYINALAARAGIQARLSWLNKALAQLPE